MGKYKERGSNSQEIKYLREKGIDKHVFSLKINTETGLHSLEGRGDIFGNNKVFRWTGTSFFVQVSGKFSKI